MYKIEQKPYGLKFMFSQTFTKDQIQVWSSDCELLLKETPSFFNVFIDIRDLKPISPQSEQILSRALVILRQHGMERTVVLANNETLIHQINKVSEMSGISHNQRYINCSLHANWQNLVERWLLYGVEPFLRNEIEIVQYI